MTVAEVMEYQREAGLSHTHVVWIGSDGFSIAHTDEERNTSGFELWDCPIHEWLLSLDGPPVFPGLYACKGTDARDLEVLNL